MEHEIGRVDLARSGTERLLESGYGLAGPCMAAALDDVENRGGRTARPSAPDDMRGDTFVVRLRIALVVLRPEAHGRVDAEGFGKTERERAFVVVGLCDLRRVQAAARVRQDRIGGAVEGHDRYGAAVARC